MTRPSSTCIIVSAALLQCVASVAAQGRKEQLPLAGYSAQAETAAALPPSAANLEVIDASYRNCRGINYLATYPSLNGMSGYHGVASSTAMWYHYDTGPGGTWVAVDQQLGWLRKSGINTVRVFLSFPAWEWFDGRPELNQIPGKNDAVRRYEHFLSLCKSNGLWCSPVLWDETLAMAAPEPIPGTVHGNMGGWHTNPGEARMRAFLAADPTLESTPAGRYVVDFAGASPIGSSFLFWHLMNEPAAPDQLATDFISATLGILARAAPNQPTLLLAALVSPAASLSQLARDPRVDLLGIHPYGVTRGAIEAQVYDATHFPDPQHPSGFVRKPIIATEIGSPGLGSAYVDAVNYARFVPRTDLGTGEKGVGFMPWVSNIGWADGNYPLKESNGLFYGDGEVRETDEVMAFVVAATAQGVPTSSLWRRSQLIEKATGDPLYVEQRPLSEALDSYADLEQLLTTEPLQFGWSDYTRAVSTLAHAGHVTAYLASSANGNPYGMVGVPFRGDPATQSLLITFLPNIAVPESPNWPQFRAASEQFCGTPFNKADPCHLMFITTRGVAPWRGLLAPYVLGQGGPYPTDNDLAEPGERSVHLQRVGVGRVFR